MKKTFKLALVMALVVVMALSLVACGGNNAPVESSEQVECNWTGLPIFDTMQTITCVSEDGNSTLEDIQDAYNFVYYKEKANMDIRITNGRPMATKIVMLMATNNLPDFIWRTRLNYANFTKYCYEGNYFLDFNPYIEAGKMPGLVQFDAYNSGIYLDNCRSANTGELNGFLKTNLQGPAGGNIGNGSTTEWNMAMMDAADAEIPFTRDELFATLYALKEEYGPSTESFVIASAKGDFSQGLHRDLVKGIGFRSVKRIEVVVNEEGKFIPWYEDDLAMENVRNLMKDFYTLYVDGLVDPYFETRTMAEVQTLALNNKVAVGYNVTLSEVNNPENYPTFTANGGTWTARTAHTYAPKTTDMTSYVIDEKPVNTGEFWGCIRRDTKYADGLVRFFEWHFDDFTKHGQEGKGDLEINSYDRELTLLTNMYVIGYNVVYENGAFDFSPFMDESYGGDTWLFQRSQFIPEFMLFGHNYGGGWYDRMEGSEADTKWTWERCMNFSLFEGDDLWEYNNISKTGAIKLAATRGIGRGMTPTLKMNTAQTTANKTLLTDHQNFMVLWAAQFANGTKNPNDDAVWNQFISDLKQVNLNDYCNMIYDIYKQNNLEIIPYADMFS